MRLTKDIERPELTERKYKAINTCYYNSPAACADKLGEYENIDENPEHLAKIKRAFDIIKNIGILKPYETIGGQCWLETVCDATKITKEDCDLLKEVGL